MSAKSSSSAFPTNALHSALIGIVLSLAVFRFFIQDAGDRHHCEALLNEGRWLDSAHQSWQPSGCMLHNYSPKEVATCFDGRHIVFVGDSTVRQVFYAAVKHADKSIDTTAEKHSDRDITVGKTKFSFYWDPFLNSTRMAQLLDGSLGQSVGGGTPTMAVIGSGIWYLRHPDSGGINAWNHRMDALFSAVSPSGPVVADDVILMPVENAIESRLSPERAATVHLDDIKTMNEALDRRLHEPQFKPTLAIPRAFNQLIDGLEDETLDGLHFSEPISKVQASILFNLRCNDVLPKKFPFDKTCCSQYPTPNWVQSLLLLILLAWAPAGLYLYSRSDISISTYSFFPEQKYLLPITIFGLAVSFLFVADRTSLFLKENKQYDALTFGVLCLAALGAGLATMKPAEKDLGFLNRDQTDEWKGWMQIAILIYHYVGASKISGIYNPIRVLVAAYLFQTGYGHLSFFLKKADFGFSRVANIVIRLNLLTVALAYVMHTDYLSYYFSPLVTIWFGIIWVTMWAGHQYNERPAFLLGKLAIAAALTAVYFQMEGPLEATFSVVNAIFATEWNAKEWRFRVTLDMWIVWVGMLTAYAFIKIKEARLTDRPEWPQWQRMTIIGSAVTMAAYFVFELTRASKFVYNGWHPYVSMFPVLAFCVLRNATPYLRSTSSKFFIFFGQCSLETFIIQFHLFIAGE
ncbi:10 TM acyl transferase domain found in Cas1p-domain-containing protein [Leucosporidium creatinivorum]|uniref:10 TM acyl transferase domain found in Cas1p-domain-containing protein n=1 Tax=Leucosporidium creatinivorum TaxID=106004 RepID=A0A1Y2DDQ3_9BASI|nr:10 TM acyl transferase domain found in Cas1p-domain-containing protein [Leucosporidium creatinivorum]